MCAKSPGSSQKSSARKFLSNQTINFRSLGTTPISRKTTLIEKAILGALGEFRGILRVALGIRNSILGMSSHDLSNTKTKILGATPGAIPGTDKNPHERFSFAPAFSERLFKNWGGSRASENYFSQINSQI